MQKSTSGRDRGVYAGAAGVSICGLFLNVVGVHTGIGFFAILTWWFIFRLLGESN
jgi:hypothetical protein